MTFSVNMRMQKQRFEQKRKIDLHKRDSQTHKSIGNSGLGWTSATTHQDVPASEHLQGVQRKIHSGQEAAFASSGGHDDTPFVVRLHNCVTISSSRWQDDPE